MLGRGFLKQRFSTLVVKETVNSVSLSTRTQRSTLLLPLNPAALKSPQYSVPLQFIVPYVSRRLIFHGLIPTDKNKGEPILRHKRKVQVSCLNFCVAWAITLIEPRSALFTFYGRLILFLSITRNPTVRVTPERLLLKNCSNWACIRDSDGPAFSRYGTQTLFKNLRKP
jgi:hypothetical protein